MRLLTLIPGNLAYGGIELHAVALCAAMARAGHESTLVTTGVALAEHLRAQLTQSGVRLRAFPWRGSRLEQPLKLGWPHWLARRERADLIYTNGLGASASILWRALRPGGRRVHHFHTACEDWEARTWPPAVRRVLEQVPELIGCSHYTARALNHFLGRSDARFLPCITRRVPHVEREPRAVPPLRFGFVGRPTQLKGVDLLLAASQRPELADIAWELHGEGPEFPAEKYRDHSRVTFFGGYSSLDELARRLARLDAVVLPTRQTEGRPISLMEAMGAGLPWVAAPRGGIGEMAPSPADAELLPGDAALETFVVACRRLADRILRGETDPARIRAHYEKEFAPERVTEQWLRFFGGA
jgi:glycosyltransferase involved in cell wall biosynthesis